MSANQPGQLPPPRLWLSQRGMKNQTGECESLAREIERKIAADTAKLMKRWEKK